MDLGSKDGGAVLLGGSEGLGRAIARRVAGTTRRADGSCVQGLL